MKSLFEPWMNVPAVESLDSLGPDFQRQLPAAAACRVLVVGDVTLAGQYGQSVLAADEQFVYFGPVDLDSRPSTPAANRNLAQKNEAQPPPAVNVAQPPSAVDGRIATRFPAYGGDTAEGGCATQSTPEAGVPHSSCAVALGTVRRVPLESIRRLRIDGFVGNCSLVLERDGDSIQAVRFTQSKVAQFEAAARKLSGLIAARTGQPADAESADALIHLTGRRPPTCPKCNRVLSPRAEVCIYCTDKRRLFIRLTALLRPHWKVALAGFLATLVVAGLNLVPAAMTKWMIDWGILPRNVHVFVLLLAGYAGAMLLSNAINFFRIRLMGWLGQRVIYDLRRATFNRLAELSLRYYESKQTGKLMNRITTDTERIERFVVEGLQEVIVDVMTLLAISAILFANNWRLAVIVILPTPLIATMVYQFTRRIKSTYRRAWRMAASLSAHLADIIPGVRVVKGFAREQEEAQRFDRRSSRLFQHNYDVARQRSAVFPVITMMTQVAYILLWTVGGWWAIQQFRTDPSLLSGSQSGQGRGTMLGTLFMFSQLLWRFYDPVNRLSQMSDQVQRATTSAERVFELLDAFPEVAEPANPKHLGGAVPPLPGFSSGAPGSETVASSKSGEGIRIRPEGPKALSRGRKPPDDVPESQEPRRGESNPAIAPSGLGVLRQLSGGLRPRPCALAPSGPAKYSGCLQQSPGSGPFPRAVGHIVFRDIRFCYESNLPVLQDINLEIQPGEMIGVVGHSGVGKSTLASLLLRFYDPDAGQVLLDGIDVRDLPLTELRRSIGLVLQEPTLFHGSVKANICYGQSDASAEQVILAAKVANAHQFLLRLPEGYDTEIGERGVRLSQGEKQRISIARAILPDPPILILDEATASVDTETERLIQAALDRLIRGRTVLAIAHRLSTLRNADRIIVLSEGRIAEVGTHAELMDREGLYYQLCQAQSMAGAGDVPPSPSPGVDPPGQAEGATISEGEGEEVTQGGY